MVQWKIQKSSTSKDLYHLMMEGLEPFIVVPIKLTPPCGIRCSIFNVTADVHGIVNVPYLLTATEGVYKFDVYSTECKPACYGLPQLVVLRERCGVGEVPPTIALYSSAVNISPVELTVKVNPVGVSQVTLFEMLGGVTTPRVVTVDPITGIGMITLVPSSNASVFYASDGTVQSNLITMSIPSDIVDVYHGKTSVELLVPANSVTSMSNVLVRVRITNEYTTPQTYDLAEVVGIFNPVLPLQKSITIPAGITADIPVYVTIGQIYEATTSVDISFTIVNTTTINDIITASKSVLVAGVQLPAGLAITKFWTTETQQLVNTPITVNLLLQNTGQATIGDITISDLSVHSMSVGLLSTTGDTLMMGQSKLYTWHIMFPEAGLYGLRVPIDHIQAILLDGTHIYIDRDAHATIPVIPSIGT